MQSGTASHTDLYRSVGREVPEALQLYDSFGRFRDALLIHELKSAPDDAVRARLKIVLQKFGACTTDLSSP